MSKKKMKRKPRELPTLAQCEKGIGEKAETWVARCYEISCAIVNRGLVDGVAVYGHWLGDVDPKSHFAQRGGRLPFIPHGWILLDDGRVLDPTRWVFEAVDPYLYVGEPPDHWSVTPCMHCGLLKEEHRDDGPDDQCDMFEVAKWPYDEGGNQWREAATIGRPIPAPQGKLHMTKLEGFTLNWVGSLFGVDAKKLAVNQLVYLANMSYETIKRAVGAEGLRAIYETICDFDDTSVSWIPIDNFNRARRECGLKRS